MHKKWVINNNILCIGRVDFHKDLNRDNSTTIGGGWWHLDRKAGVLYLYSRSQDFGQVTQEQVINAEKCNDIQGLKIIFSLEDSLLAVLAKHTSSRYGIE